MAATFKKISMAFFVLKQLLDPAPEMTCSLTLEFNPFIPVLLHSFLQWSSIKMKQAKNDSQRDKHERFQF